MPRSRPRYFRFDLRPQAGPQDPSAPAPGRGRRSVHGLGQRARGRLGRGLERSASLRRDRSSSARAATSWRSAPRTRQAPVKLNPAGLIAGLEIDPGGVRSVVRVVAETGRWRASRDEVGGLARARFRRLVLAAAPPTSAPLGMAPWGSTDAPPAVPAARLRPARRPAGDLRPRPEADPPPRPDARRGPYRVVEFDPATGMSQTRGQARRRRRRHGPARTPRRGGHDWVIVLTPEAKP